MFAWTAEAASMIATPPHIAGGTAAPEQDGENALEAVDGSPAQYILRVAREVAEKKKKALQAEEEDGVGRVIQSESAFKAWREEFLAEFEAVIEHDFRMLGFGLVRRGRWSPEVVRGTKSFLGVGAGLPYGLPAAAFAVPQRLLRDMWRGEYEKRQENWRDEGRKLFASEVRRSVSGTVTFYEQGTAWLGTGIKIHAPFEVWVGKHPLWPEWLMGPPVTGSGSLLFGKPTPKERIEWLMRQYEGSEWGYARTKTRGGAEALTCERKAEGDLKKEEE
eukprot:g5238.t1